MLCYSPKDIAMLVKLLLSEFMREAESTRKLLNAIPDSALDYKPSDKSWTTAQLASHIATIYDWYKGVFRYTAFDMGTHHYEKGDISKAANIVAKFEENVKEAQTLIEEAQEEAMFDQWSMLVNGQIVMPPAPRIEVIRGFLMNHIYHHRGEMIIYLRATGNTVPGLYGPTAEDSMR